MCVSMCVCVFIGDRYLASVWEKGMCFELAAFSMRLYVRSVRAGIGCPPHTNKHSNPRDTPYNSGVQHAHKHTYPPFPSDYSHTRTRTHTHPRGTPYSPGARSMRTNK